MTKGKSPAWERGKAEDNRRIPLIMQVRNRCRKAEELRDATRQALEEISTDYPASLDAGERKLWREPAAAGDSVILLCKYRVNPSADRSQLSLEIILPSRCAHAWTLELPSLEMVGYWMMYCSCIRDGGDRRAGTTSGRPYRNSRRYS